MESSPSAYIENTFYCKNIENTFYCKRTHSTVRNGVQPICIHTRTRTHIRTDIAIHVRIHINTYKDTYGTLYTYILHIHIYYIYI